jgi:hypothetical protein
VLSSVLFCATLDNNSSAPADLHLPHPSPTALLPLTSLIPLRYCCARACVLIFFFFFIIIIFFFFFFFCRLEDMLDESHVALAEAQGELAGLKQVVCLLEEEIAQLDSASAGASAHIDASLADELTTGGRHCDTDVEALQRQVHSMLASVETTLGVIRTPPDSCVLRLKHLLNDVTARTESESNARCLAKQTISDLTEHQRACESEIERLHSMIRTMTSHQQRPRRAAQSSTVLVDHDEYLKTLDTLEAQVGAARRHLPLFPCILVERVTCCNLLRTPTRCALTRE